MGIRKRKPAVAPARPQRQPQPVDSAFAAEVRRRAEKLAEPVENPREKGTRARSHQRQQAERQMAKLRSEAVQARRLAEHIENLSQDAAASRHKRKQAMTDTTIVDPGHAQRLQRRTDDKPGPGGSQLNFNPLHPSMELPPEQLIRLLGMESKKIRNSRKTPRASEQDTVAPLETVDVQADNTAPPAKVRPQAVRPANRSIQYERCEAPQVFDNGRSGLLVPSILVGVVAGIVVSGYLFWYQPADTVAQKTPAPVIAKQPQKPQPKHQLVKRTPAPIAPAAKPAPKQNMSAQEKMEWQASVEAEEQRLRIAAQQHLAERVSQLQQTSRQVELQPALVNDSSPEPAPEPAFAPEPANGFVSPVDTPVNAPLETPYVPDSGSSLPERFPTAAETPDTYESPAVMPALVPVEEIPVSEPAPAEPVATDIQPEMPPQSEADPVLTPVTPAEDAPAAPADNNLL